MFPVKSLNVSAYTIPTPPSKSHHESDGTIAWDRTSMVLVQVTAGDETGLGYSYADPSAGQLIHRVLKNQVVGKNALDIALCWISMIESVRNIGRPGIASMAISAVDNALWDLKSKLLGLPLVSLFGQVRESIPVYGSGGFTSSTLSELEDQLGGWVEQGISQVKMKVARHPDKDLERVEVARRVIGPSTRLFVDANGGYQRKQALVMADHFRDLGVSWLEEPVSSDDLEGLRFIREHMPHEIEIAAGEYGFDPRYFRQMLEAQAVDVLQMDATRCLGFTGFLQAAAVCASYGLPLSAHTAPSLHAHVCCAIQEARHVEYFSDHARIENLFFDGVIQPIDGALRPDPVRPGLGLKLKKSDVEKFAA